MVRRSLTLAMLLALAGAGSGRAQILVAPIQLFLRERAPLGTFYLYNQSQQSQEIAISFRFGYPVASDSGGAGMLYGDTLPLKERSMQGWVRAFPRQFVLGPGQRQEVRITARPPQDLPEGMYWTRLVTTSTPQVPSVDSVAPGVSARIIFKLEQITTVLFARGQTATALSADTPRVRLDSVQLSFFAHIAPGGNAPFFGTSTLRIRNAGGVQLDSSIVKFAMYTPIVQRFDFARKSLPPGTYRAELRVTSERDDIAAQDLLRTEPVVREVPFTIP